MPRDNPIIPAFNSPAEALAALREHIVPVIAETVSLAQAAGRVLAQPVYADRSSPAVSVSAMDGYAVRMGDLAAGSLPLAGEVRIGREPPELPERAALRIVTGGAIPPGAEAVIRREDVTECSDRISWPVTLIVKPGQSIRREGENLSSGTLVATPYRRITPALAGALATFGVAAPLVFRRVRVAILTTGDEVLPPEQAPSRWQLRDSNAAALRTLLDPLPCFDSTHRHVPDDPVAMSQALAVALDSADAILLTGGVSMGHRDFVADTLAAHRIRTIFHGIPQRPGKPVLGAITSDGRPILALPGNPVSVLVTARRLALPALLTRAGEDARHADLVHAALMTNPDASSLAIWHHRPVRIVQPGRVELLDSRSSGDVPGAAAADGFVEIPPNTTSAGPWPFYSWHA